MNRHQTRLAQGLPAGLTLRPARDTDEGFLYRLFVDSRSKDTVNMPLPEDAKEQLLRMQHRAQQTQYRNTYPGAHLDVIEHRGEAVGLLLVDRGETEMHVVDFALLAGSRGAGIGNAVLRNLLAEADNTGLPVALHVTHDNPAQRLYRRLGFQPEQDQGFYLFMRRPPATTRQN